MIVISAPLTPFSRSARALNAGGIDERDSTETYADLARWARCPSTARVQLLFLDPISIGLDGHHIRRHVVLPDLAPIGTVEISYLGTAVKSNQSEKFLVAKPSRTDD
jgi:hypothetical protein